MSRYARVLTTELGGAPVVAKRANDPAAAALLEAELRRLRSAAHPGVVEIVATTDRPCAGFATAWAGGSTLASIDLGPEELASVLAQVCDTLTDLHHRGFVHGRIDPSHVVIGTNLRPTLCGVGIGPAPTFGAGATGPTPADDVHAIGRLILRATGTDADEEPVPLHRWDRRGPWKGAIRRALQTLGDQATHPDPQRRPTIRSLGSDLHALAGPGRRSRAPRGWRLPIDALVIIVGTAAVLLSARSLAAARQVDLSASAGGRQGLAVQVGLLAVHIGAMAFTSSVVVATVLALIAERSGSSSLARWASRVTLPGLDRALVRVGGLGLGALVALSAPVRASNAAPTSSSVESAIERLPDGTATPLAAPDRAPVARGVVATTVGKPRTPPPGAARRAEKVLAAPTNPASWIVQRGDHLWSISETTLARHLGRTPTTAETAVYWQRVVRTNANLADPDVIIPGRAISLPPL